MIKLKEINEKNLGECLRLKRDPDNFCASNADSLAQAWVNYEIARPFAIYNDDEMVGFVMLAMDDIYIYNPLPGRNGSSCCLWRLMIEEKHQGKGYGKEAMKLVIEYAKTISDFKRMRSSVELKNLVARNLYKSLGFEFTGEIDFDDAEGNYDPDDCEEIIVLEFK